MSALRKTKKKDAPQRSRRKSVTFRIRAEPGSHVQLAGSFNDWNIRRHTLRYYPREGVFRVTLLLPPGDYEYKFLVNGEWTTDPASDDTLANAFGSHNNVLRIPE